MDLYGIVPVGAIKQFRHLFTLSLSHSARISTSLLRTVYKQHD